MWLVPDNGRRSEDEMTPEQEKQWTEEAESEYRKHLKKYGYSTPTDSGLWNSAYLAARKVAQEEINACEVKFRNTCKLLTAKEIEYRSLKEKMN